MVKMISNAIEVVRTTLGKITKVSQPVSKFILHIVPLWLSMNGRYVFMNLQRWGGRSEKSYRNMFSKTFDWFHFNCEVAGAYFKGKVLAVFDPFYIKKGGKKTYGLGKFWSGTAARALKGLEAGCLAFIGVEEHTALHGIAMQSPSPERLHRKGKTLVEHYLKVITDYVKEIKVLTSYLLVDGYFMKRDFIAPLLLQGLHIITKARRDANLCYVYKGKQKQKGRKRICDGKMDTSDVDRRRLRLICSNKEMDVFAGVLYSVQLKRKVLAAFVYYKEKKTGKYKKNKTGKVKPEIIIATDVEMKPETMCEYYGLRFQVEFLIRDAKSYCGVEHCQATGKQKLHNHFNIALTAVSIAKAAYYLSLPKRPEEGFSMMDVKMIHMNALLTNRIFSNLDINPSCQKYQQAYENSLNFGRLRA